MMLGFAGWVEFNNHPRDKKVLKKMLHILAVGEQDGIDFISKDYISLGVSQSHILPGLFHDENTIFVGNARLDDKSSLLSKLQLSLEDAKTFSDEQLLFNAYLKWGDRAIDHLLGDFVFTVWDTRYRRLTLCRDSIGGKSLFYYHQNEKLIFSTALKPLINSSLLKRELNEEKLLDYLILEQQDPQQTFFKNINIFPAGHLMHFELDDVQSRRYWQADINKRMQISDKQEFHFELQFLFETVVKDRLDDSKTNAVMLSGGLDSASVACSAARSLAQKNRTLFSYTSVPLAEFTEEPQPGTVYDETDYVESIKSLYSNIESQFIDAKEHDVLSILTTTFESTCMPPRNLVNQLWIQAILDKAAKDGMCSLLTGFCGNYFLSMAGTNLFIESLQKGNLMNLHKQLSLYSKLNVMSYFSLVKSLMIIPYIPKSIWRAYQEKRFGRSINIHREIPINPGLISSKEISRRCREIDPYYRASKNWRKQSVAVLDIFSGDVATMENGLSLQSGVTMLDPTRDRRLIEFCLSVPTDQYLNEGRSRLLVRDGLASILPEKIRSRTAFGYQDADRTLRLNQMRDEISKQMNSLCHHDTVRKYIDVDTVMKLLESSTLEDSYSANFVSRSLSISKFIAWIES